MKYKIAMIAAAALALALALAGCAPLGAQFAKMAEPADGGRARVRIAANMLVRGIPESSCIDWSRAGAGTVFGGIVGSGGYRGRRLGMPNPFGRKDRESGEMYVRAGQPVTYVLSNTPESPLRCDLAITFIPEAGRDYELSMNTGRVDLVTAVCSARVADITEGLTPVAIQQAAACR